MSTENTQDPKQPTPPALASVNGWTAAIGKRLVSAKADEHRITLKFEEGITAEITSDGGIGYNEGLSWLNWEVEPPNAAGELQTPPNNPK